MQRTAHLDHHTYTAAQVIVSAMITALAERAMSFWPNKGEADPRPPLGSGYHRLKAVMPHRPIVPAGAPAKLRLDAKKDDVIPRYPY